MRFAAIVHIGDTKEYEAGALPSANALEVMGKFNDELINAGVMLSGDGFHASSKGALIRFGPDNKPAVTEGPFEDTQGLIGGFWIWKVRSKKEAVEWAKRAPMDPGDTIELRRLFEPSDFGGEVEAHEKARLKRIEKQQKGTG